MSWTNYPGHDLREQLIHLGREAVHAGLVIGSGGNLSARSPGEDSCWITASGSWLDRLHRHAFTRIRIPDGRPLFPELPAPSVEWRLHTEIYRVRPDVTAIVHLHPQMSVLLTALGVPIRLVTSDHAYYLREVVTVPFHPPGSEELAHAAAEQAARGANVLVLAHHGCAVLADSVELAHRRAFNLEEAARATYAAVMLTGDPARVPSCPPEFLARGVV